MNSRPALSAVASTTERKASSAFQVASLRSAAAKDDGLGAPPSPPAPLWREARGSILRREYAGVPGRTRLSRVAPPASESCAIRHRTAGSRVRRHVRQAWQLGGHDIGTELRREG